MGRAAGKQRDDVAGMLQPLLYHRVTVFLLGGGKIVCDMVGCEHETQRERPRSHEPISGTCAELLAAELVEELRRTGKHWSGGIAIFSRDNDFASITTVVRIGGRR